MNLPIGTRIKIISTSCSILNNNRCIGDEGYISNVISGYPAVHFAPNECSCNRMDIVTWCSGINDKDCIVLSSKELI